MPKPKEKGTSDGEVIGHCNYCKDDIYEDDDYVNNHGKRYHLECYKLVQEELDEENA